MKQTLTVYDFCELMKADPYSNFSHDALLAIFDHIEQLEEETGEELEFNRVNIRIMFYECETEQEAIEEFNFDPTGWNDGIFLKLPNGGYVITVN